MDAIEKRIGDMTDRLGVIETLLRGLLDQRSEKDWYSPAEVAEILGKQPLTVREWCRLGRCHCEKRPTGRGRSKEWMISANEVERLKNHRLLPIKPFWS